MLFPSAAWLDPDADAWRVPIHGWIYEEEQEDAARAAMILGLRELLGDDPRLESPLFERRLRPFIWDNERGKEVPIQVGELVFTSSPSLPNGHFAGVATLPTRVALRVALQRTGREPPPLLSLRALTRPSDDREFSTQSLLVGPEGLTVVSDIDDTIKITQVRDHAAMLENTFLEPFRPVPDMAELYGDWLADAHAGHLHFVSSSPWQLFPELQSMLDAAGFPPATFDLKSIRLADASVADLFADPAHTKSEPILRLFTQFPARKFALVGDSGEKDPEIYGELAREHPDRVVYIAIRDVTGEAANSPRYRDAFRDVKARWEVFTDPKSLTGPQP